MNKNKILAALLMLLMLLLLGSCKTTRITEPVIVERIQHDTLHVTETRRDSIYMHDSIYIHAVNDTIYSERWHTKYIESKVRYDSIVSVHDTIPVITTITQIEKERFTPWYTQALAVFGAVTLLFVMVFLFFEFKGRW